MQKNILILAVFIVASCGLAYELIASALTSYLVGDTILQFSTIIGTYLFAMGVGAAFSKYVKEENLIPTFIDIEIAVALLGGLSATIFMISFFYIPASFKSVLYVYIFSIGSLVGMEIPLVMRILNDNKEDFKQLISNVLSFDYLGALFVSLIFPLICMPYLGINRTAVAFGFSNLFVAILSMLVFKKSAFSKTRNIFVIFIFLLLSSVFYFSEFISNYAEKGIYGNQIIFSTLTKYQKLLITKRNDDIRLFINGNLQFSSRDEYRYHEALVIPAMVSHKHPQNVLILGGGDGMALREVLEFNTVSAVTLVDLDSKMTEEFKENELLSNLNAKSFHDKKVKVINGDASKWLESNKEFYDVIIIDFPDPSNYAIGKLYSSGFYKLVSDRLSFNGVGVVQSTSAYFAPNVYWTIYSTIKDSGLLAKPYHVYVPSFGDWGFFLFSHKEIELGKIGNRETKFLNDDNMLEMFNFPKDMNKIDLPPNRLSNQSVVELFNKDWEHVH